MVEWIKTPTITFDILSLVLGIHMTERENQSNLNLSSEFHTDTPHKNKIIIKSFLHKLMCTAVNEILLWDMSKFYYYLQYLLIISETWI